MPSAEFEKAVADVKYLEEQRLPITSEDRLALYALSKQATVGDICTVRPGCFDFLGRVKWDAWDAKKGLSSEEAEQQYISRVEELKTRYASIYEAT